MNANFDFCFDRIIKSEGGYVWDKDDAGGETNLGVTKQAWSEFLKRPIQDGEMKKLTVSDVKPFYKQMYWDSIKCDDLPSGLDYVVFDFGINAGTKKSAKFLQRVVGAVEDGSVGPATLALVKTIEVPLLIKTFTELKEKFYNSIVEKNGIQVKFLKGWMNRVASVQTTAESMVS
jgi:lysozyme family protein